MVMEWREIKDRIEDYYAKKYAETGILPIFRKNNLVHHLKLNEEDAKHVKYALTTLVKEGKISKYGSHTYRWNSD